MTDAELVRLEARAMKLIARSEALRVQGEELDHRLDEIQTEIANEPADTALGALVKIKLCIEKESSQSRVHSTTRPDTVFEI